MFGDLVGLTQFKKLNSKSVQLLDFKGPNVKVKV